MFTKIVVGMDGSEGAERAFAFAVGVARADGADLVFAHVEEYTIGKGGGPIHVGEEDFESTLRSRAKELERRGRRDSRRGHDGPVGGPAPAIREIADRLGADLIVVGTRGHTPLAGVVLGSVAQRLLTIAEQPVLVVPEGAKPPAGATEMPATEGATA